MEYPRQIDFYDQPHQMEPLVPNLRVEILVEHTRSVIMRSSRLQGLLCQETRDAVRDWVRILNAHHSNTIELDGVSIPLIEDALNGGFADDEETARKQRLAIAHIAAEKAIETSVASAISPMSWRFLREAHTALYSQLNLKDRVTPDARLVEPGHLRTHEVAVGRHQPPASYTLLKFLNRMDEVYPAIDGLDRLLYAVASMHHRATWVHPFEDGNGRAIRLHTHAVLLPVSGGLWSPTRAFGANPAAYFDGLANADAHRRGALDGRGNLSETALFEWCMYFIQVCADEVSLMTRLLEPEILKERIAQLVTVKGYSVALYRNELVLPLQHLAVAGPLRVSAFIQMMGLPAADGERVLAHLVSDKLLKQEGGRVSFRFPLDAMSMLLPGLIPPGNGPT